MSAAGEPVVASAAALARFAGGLRFEPPVAFAYNPLDYAWPLHEAYLRRFAGGPRRVLFLGMNPGPFGMAQTGVPFGEVAAVRDWMGLSGAVGRPAREHPKRPVEGLRCARSEVSGRRLWGLFAARFGAAEAFFADHFVHNHCPLAFMDAGGANLTPDKLRGEAVRRLLERCDAHLAQLVRALHPRVLVGIGRYAAGRLAGLETGLPVLAAPHPSPANPGANRDWAGSFTRVLVDAGVWPA